MRNVFIVAAKRTPQVKSGLDFKEVSVPHLAIGLLQNILDSYPKIENTSVDEVIFGNIGAPPQFANISRVIALEAGLDQKTSAYTVNRNCAAGMEAVAQATLKIATSRAELIFAGGLESMSQMPLIFSKEMTDMFIELMKAKSLKERLTAFGRFRPYFLKPIIAIEKGLTDPFCGLNMGQTAELLARELNITREEQDTFANYSHQKACAATKEGRFHSEIVPVLVGNKMDRILTHDVGPRSDSSVERLGQMRPFFDKKSGSVTVGNSCPITDGGSALLLASEEAVNRHALTPLARIVDYSFNGVAPKYMGLGPISSISALLKRTGQTMDAIDLFEINEAFSAQIIAVQKIAKDAALCSRFVGLSEALGEIPSEKLNVNGGGVALGHPVGSSGSRIIVTLVHELMRRRGKWGVASLCIGGGQGGAVLVENLAL
ncbi:MAG: acetyl-CoA C-acyltransferase [Oligoflexia bacterium]|nr:acetyl-CoA C-acyltransferase [Oligoflexia bacterium]